MAENAGEYKLQLTGEEIDAALQAVHEGKVVRNDAQTLTDEQKAQARANIGTVINTQLDTAGQVADAKAVGDALTTQATKIDATETMLAKKEASTTATSNYTVGNLVIVGDQLLEVTSPIASGETISVGTNVKVSTLAEQVEDLESTKANTTGEYDGLISGMTKQIMSTKGGEEDSGLYSFRTTGGGLDVEGAESVEKIIGGTLLWNQIAKPFNSTNWKSNNVTGLTFNNGIASFTAPSNNAGIMSKYTERLYSGHYYYYACDYELDEALPSGASIIVLVNLYKGFPIATSSSPLKGRGRGVMCVIANSPATSVTNINFRVTGISSATHVSLSNLILIDLTQMFGTTIASYLNSLERANAGAGVAWFRRLFPSDDYTYNKGTLMSVNAYSHKMVGFNAFNKTTGTAKLLGGVEYQITGFYTSLAYSTGETITPDENGKFITSVIGTLTVTGGDGSTCVHLAWDGERDGENESYSEHEYPFDNSVTLRGIASFDANHNLVYDGDTYALDGTVTRKYAELTNVTGAVGDVITLTGIDTTSPKVLISAGLLTNIGTLSGNELTLTYALSSATIVYNLATTTTESANPYSQLQVCDNWGTEEFVDAGVVAGTRDVSIPVGHLTTYQADLRAKLESAPSSPEIDGDYIMRRSNGVNSYAPFTQSDIDVDETLSEEGEAADAKAAGDGIHGTQEMIAPREATDTATQNYAIGDYLVYDDKLYKVTAAIANGETITPGTNVTEDKVATELLALEENKADKDGKIALAEYANQLVSTVGESDDIPYVFRKTGGSLEVGRRVALKDIVGGSIIWNQIIKNGNFASNTGWSNTTGVTRSIANNKCTLTAKSNIGADYISATSTAGARNWDVYFVSAYVTASRATHIQLAVKAKKGSKIAVPANKRTYCGAIIKATNAGLAYAIYINASSELQQGDTVVIENAKSINLTEAFGGWTIANYVLALETATPGAGLAWVQKLFPNEYYTYDPGTVRSVNVSAHKTVGFNAFDLAAGTAKLIGGIEYQITGAYSALSYSSGETITPDENGKFTPTVNGVMTVTGGSGTTCVHLVWDGERDGQYEAYSAHTYALDDSVTLRGFPTVDSNNNFVYDGDTYAPDGTVTRKYAEMTGVTGAIGDTVTLTGIDTNATNILTSAGRLENVGTLSGDTLTLTAALTDATIVYPLATPTTEAADPYTETQICDNWGTEEFEDAGVAAGTRDVVIPVGHDSVYGSNLRDKLEAAPDSPDADGDYIMHRENGQNSYFRFNVLEYIQAAQPWYVGADLTTKFADEIATFDNVWAWIQHRIQSGNFLGLNIGDFIPYTANSKNYKAHIAGINTYKNSGDVGNHIDFVTDKAFGTAHAYNKAAYNNGLIPVETITGDGTTTEFVLTKEMTEVASVKMGSTSLTGWTYDATTYTLTFAEAPSAGSITVTGTGEKCPWLASDLYHWLNSKAGQVPNGKTVNPAVVHVDYTSGGVYYYLPDTMKAVIVEKRAYLPERYNASQLLTDDNGGSFHDMGKIWVPSEVEVYGAPLYGSKFASAGSCQYPIFHSMENRKKVNISNPGQQISWWHSSPYSGSAADACAGAFNVNAAHIAANSTGGFAVVCFRIA